ncbi:HutD/Ves family protein [Bartonella sp. B35(2025)]
MQLLKADQYKVMSWKNGGGSTREIAFALNDNGEIDWRLSIATISQSGPFSNFEGIDRTIVLLDGDQVTLNIAGQPAVVLDYSSQPFTFAGEADVDAVLNGRETIDLNIMTRRKIFRHHISKIDTKKDLLLQKDVEYMFIVFNADYKLGFEGRIINVSRFDTLVLENSDTISLYKGKGTVFSIEIYSY